MLRLRALCSSRGKTSHALWRQASSASRAGVLAWRAVSPIATSNIQCVFPSADWVGCLSCGEAAGSPGVFLSASVAISAEPCSAHGERLHHPRLRRHRARHVPTAERCSTSMHDAGALRSSAQRASLRPTGPGAVFGGEEGPGAPSLFGRSTTFLAGIGTGGANFRRLSSRAGPNLKLSFRTTPDADLRPTPRPGQFSSAKRARKCVGKPVFLAPHRLKQQSTQEPRRMAE